MKISSKLVVATLAIALIAAGGIYVCSPQTTLPLTTNEPIKNGVAEAIFQSSFPDLTGKKQALAQWQGKILIVNFWATWCPPCLAEIPGFIRMQNQFAAQGVQFIGIAIDREKKVLAYADKLGMNYPVLLGDLEGIDLTRRTGNAQGGLPYTVIIDRNGNIVATQLGMLRREKLEEIIKPLL